ncbi:hypothetical protein KJ632_01530 [Patescibacteria group bacterium]|nr:hypothetical protein [Patescibacteria group bacterium]
MISEIANTVFLGIAFRGWMGLLGLILLFLSISMVALREMGIAKDLANKLHRIFGYCTVVCVVFYAFFVFVV